MKASADSNVQLARPLRDAFASACEIAFTPIDLGTRTATVRIFTNDRFAPAFTFTIGGTGA